MSHQRATDDYIPDAYVPSLFRPVFMYKADGEFDNDLTKVKLVWKTGDLPKIGTSATTHVPIELFKDEFFLTVQLENNTFVDYVLSPGEGAEGPPQFLRTDFEEWPFSISRIVNAHFGHEPLPDYVCSTEWKHDHVPSSDWTLKNDKQLDIPIGTRFCTLVIFGRCRAFFMTPVIPSE